jgi:hypothetical protein
LCLVVVFSVEVVVIVGRFRCDVGDDVVVLILSISFVFGMGFLRVLKGNE